MYDAEQLVTACPCAVFGQREPGGSRWCQQPLSGRGSPDQHWSAGAREAAAGGWRYHAEGTAALGRRWAMPEEISPEGWRLWAPHTMVDCVPTVAGGRPLGWRHKDVEYQQKTSKKERAAGKAITMALWRLLCSLSWQGGGEGWPCLTSDPGEAETRKGEESPSDQKWV